MGKKLLIAFAFLISGLCVVAQNNPDNETTLSLPKDNLAIASTAFPRSNPLFVIKADDKTAMISPATPKNHSFSTLLDGINPDWVKSITVFNNKEAVEKYGSMGEYGAVVIEMKEGTFDKMPAHISERFN